MKLSKRIIPSDEQSEKRAKSLAERREYYPAWSRYIEITSIAVFLVLISFALSQYFLIALVNQLSVWVIFLSLVAVVLAFLMADFISGVVHFLCDNFGSPETRILGPLFIRHFLVHHNQPDDIGKHDFIETNGNNFLVASLLLLPLVFFLVISERIESVFFGQFWVSLCIFLAMTNQSHKWAHQRVTPQAVMWLQTKGVLLRKREHVEHHRPPYCKNYCITSGAMNSVLEKLGFFPWLHKILSHRKRG